MARLFKADGKESIVKPANGKHFTLEELQSYVGGYIEMLNLPNLKLIINEEGKIPKEGQSKLQKNTKATGWAEFAGIADDDFVVGDALLCDSGELE